MSPRRFLLAAAPVLALLAATTSHAFPPLVEGDLVGWDRGALRRLDGGPPSSENVFSGPAFGFQDFWPDPIYCKSGAFDVEPDGDVVAYDALRNTLVRIDLETGAWHVISGLSVGTGPTFDFVNPRIEPSGSILQLRASKIWRVDGVTGDRTLFLEAPYSATKPGEFAEFYPNLIAVRPNGTIAMYSVLTSTGITQARLFDVDPVTAARTPLTYLDPAITVTALAAMDNGDVLLLSNDRIRAVDALGTVRTLSGAGVGTGPAIGWARALATNGTDVIYLTDVSHAGHATALIAIDPLTGDRELIANPNPPVIPDESVIDDIAVAPDGSVLGIGCGEKLLHIDSDTGVRSVAFDPMVGAGPDVGTLLALDHRGRLLVTGGGGGFVVRVDPTTGDRVPISSTTIGTGPQFYPRYLAVGDDGDMFAVGYNCAKEIFRIDAFTGDRSIVSQNGIEPPYWLCPYGMVVGDDGFLYVSDLGVIHRVDPATGARSVFADETHGSGPLWPSDWVGQLQRGPAGTLFALGGDSLIYQLELATGDRSIFSDAPATPPNENWYWGLVGLVVKPGVEIAMVWETADLEPTRRLIRVDPSDNVIEDSVTFVREIALVPAPPAALSALTAMAALAAKSARRRR